MASRENEKGLKYWFLNILILFSRDDKTRTCDLTPPRRVRYQLRYIPLLLKSECKGINFYWNLQTFWQVFHKIFLFKGKILEGKWGLQRRKLLIITLLRRWWAGGYSSKAYHSRTRVSAPRPPWENLFRLCWLGAGGRGTEATVLL